MSKDTKTTSAVAELLKAKGVPAEAIAAIENAGIDFAEVASAKINEDYAENQKTRDNAKTVMLDAIKDAKQTYADVCKAHPVGRNYTGGGVRNADTSEKGTERREKGFLADWWMEIVQATEWMTDEKTTRAHLNKLYRDEYLERKKEQKTEAQAKRYASKQHAYMTKGAPATA